MPYCEACDRHLTPTSMVADGSCPSCGRVLPLVAPGREGRAPAGDEEADDGPSAPWHFKVLLVGLLVYMTWRGVQGVEWVAHKL